MSDRAFQKVQSVVSSRPHARAHKAMATLAAASPNDAATTAPSPGTSDTLSDKAALEMNRCVRDLDTCPPAPSAASLRRKAVLTFVGFLVVFFALTTLAGVHRNKFLLWLQIPVALVLAYLSSGARAPLTLRAERDDRQVGSMCGTSVASIALATGLLLSSKTPGFSDNRHYMNLALLGFLMSSLAMVTSSRIDDANEINRFHSFQSCAVNMGIGFIVLGVTSGVVNRRLVGAM
jgi:hypothetical protein